MNKQPSVRECLTRLCDRIDELALHDVIPVSGITSLITEARDALRRSFEGFSRGGTRASGRSGRPMHLRAKILKEPMSKKASLVAAKLGCSVQYVYLVRKEKNSQN